MEMALLLQWRPGWEYAPWWQYVLAVSPWVVLIVLALWAIRQRAKERM
jgi:hypothetical protein